MQDSLFEIRNLRAFIPSTKGSIVTVDDVTLTPVIFQKDAHFIRDVLIPRMYV